MFNQDQDKNTKSPSPQKKFAPDFSQMPQSSMLRTRAMLRNNGIVKPQTTINPALNIGASNPSRRSSNEGILLSNQNQQSDSQAQIKQNAFLQLFGEEQSNRQATPEKIRDFSSNQSLGNFVSVVVNNIVTKIRGHGYWEKDAQQLFSKRLDTETFVNVLVEEIEKIASKVVDKDKQVTSLTRKLQNLEAIMGEKLNKIVATDRDRLTLQENHLRDQALRAETQSDFLQNENKELKKNLEASKKAEQFYVAEVERLNNKATDQAGEIIELKSKYNKLKLKHQELNGLTELHNTIDFWRKKYEQLEKEYKSELNTKESHIHLLYKTEFDARLKAHNLNHKKEKDSINENVTLGQQEVQIKQKQIDELNKQIEDLKTTNLDHVHDIEVWKQKYNNLQRKYFDSNKLLTELPKQTQEETTILKEKIREMEKAHKNEILEMKKLFEQTLQHEREAREREYNSRLLGDKKIMKSQLSETKNENEQKDFNIKVLTKENEELRAQSSDLKEEVIIIRNRYNLLEERAKKQIQELKNELSKLQKKEEMFDDLQQKKELEAMVHDKAIDQLKKALLDQDVKVHTLMAENMALKNRLFKLTGQDAPLSSVNMGQ